MLVRVKMRFVDNVRGGILMFDLSKQVPIEVIIGAFILLYLLGEWGFSCGGILGGKREGDVEIENSGPQLIITFI